MRGYLDGMRVIEEEMEKLRNTTNSIANWLDLPKSQESFKDDMLKWTKDSFDNGDSTELNKLIKKIGNTKSELKFHSGNTIWLQQIKSHLLELKITLRKKYEDIENIAKKLEKYLKLKETERVIEQYWPQKLYDDYRKEIWRLHAGNDDSWKPITEAIRDINIVKKNWINELEDFERFIKEIEKNKFKKETIDQYYNKYIDDFISFLKSHVLDKNQELDNIRNNNKGKYWIQIKNLWDFITNWI